MKRIIAILVLAVGLAGCGPSIPSEVASPRDIDCNDEWFQNLIADLASERSDGQIEIYTFSAVRQVSLSSKELVCTARVRASMMLDRIEYAIELLPDGQWYISYEPVFDW